VNGYDFYNDDGNVTDSDGHGTAVAGTVTNGYNTNVNLDLMNLKFYENERSTLFNGICAIYYAIDNGASVLNLSWGFVSTEDIPGILKDALDYAKLKDVLIMILNLNNNVEVVSGTSVSAPIVTRTAAEIRAKYPTLSSSDVRECILNTVHVYPELGNQVATSGTINHDAAIVCAHAKALSFCDETNVVYQLIHPLDTIMVSDFQITSQGTVKEPLDVSYKATNNIQLLANFNVEQGASFIAMIEDCVASVPPP